MPGYIFLNGSTSGVGVPTVAEDNPPRRIECNASRILSNGSSLGSQGAFGAPLRKGLQWSTNAELHLDARHRMGCLIGAPAG